VDDDVTGQEEARQDQRVLGRALRALRHRAGITQEELATRAGTTGTYVSLVENGHRGVRWHTIMRLIRAMDTSARALGVEIEKQQQE
jgi:transcriptional regulator with XRE-family HTH domain